MDHRLIQKEPGKPVLPYPVQFARSPPRDFQQMRVHHVGRYRALPDYGVEELLGRPLGAASTKGLAYSSFIRCTTCSHFACGIPSSVA